MSTIYSVFTPVAAAWEINERLIHHSQPGRMLAGLHYDKEGTIKVDGEDDMPLLQPWSLNLAEEKSPGAVAGGVERKNSPVAPTYTLAYRIAVNRKHGWFRRDPTDGTQPKGLMEWIALICDAIETMRPTPEEEAEEGYEPVTDCSMVNALEKPPTFRISETDTTQRAFHCYLEVELSTRHHCRGERGFTLPGGPEEDE